MKRAGIAGLALVVSAGCNPFGSGTVTARWVTAGDTAVISMPATASWCVGERRLDLRASVGDTGLGLALFPSDSALVPGDFPVVVPGGTIQVRPTARVALRWMGKVVVQGWWGDSGAVRVTKASPRALSGSGVAWLVSGLGPDSVTSLNLEFRRVPVRADTLCDIRPAPAEAPGDSAGPPAGAGVD